MKVTFFPVYDDPSVESIKVRVCLLSRYLNGKGVETEICFPSKLSSCGLFSADILFFQKTYTGQWLWIAKKAKRLNPKVKIVLDLVDKYDNVGEMLKLADVVTTDSRKLAEWYGPKSEVIPDSVAYLDSSLPVKTHVKTDDFNVAYFVAPCNVDNFEVCSEVFRHMKEKQLRLCVITGNVWHKDKSQSRHGIDVINLFRGIVWEWWKWDSETFSKMLQECDFAVNPQINDWKGGNKFVQAVTNNLPAISSDIQSYRNIAEQTGTEEFLCRTVDDWTVALRKMFNPDVRNGFLGKTLNWTWENYGMKKVGARWMELFGKLSDGDCENLIRNGDDKKGQE